MPLTPEDLPPHVRAQLDLPKTKGRASGRSNTKGGRWYCWTCWRAEQDEADRYTAQMGSISLGIPSTVSFSVPHRPVFSTWAAVTRHMEATGHTRYEQVM